MCKGALSRGKKSHYVSTLTGKEGSLDIPEVSGGEKGVHLDPRSKGKVLHGKKTRDEKERSPRRKKKGLNYHDRKNAWSNNHVLKWGGKNLARFPGRGTRATTQPKKGVKGLLNQGR